MILAAADVPSVGRRVEHVSLQNGDDGKTHQKPYEVNGSHVVNPQDIPLEDIHEQEQDCVRSTVKKAVAS